MKLKDIINKSKQKAVINERLDDIDHSTLKLKSNIAQKWTSVKDMSTDIYDWFRASIVASGPEMGDEIYDELEAMMKLMDELLDDLD
jgi:triacylglycerol esterase/lipase EstA (alpha/beta hydrolase family)|tara:strand:+ start:154 stop:414 length:261 start_codon:yes stop_codon:yes gene_type:complete